VNPGHLPFKDLRDELRSSRATKTLNDMLFDLESNANFASILKSTVRGDSSALGLLEQARMRLSSLLCTLTEYDQYLRNHFHVN